jgi:ABC-type Fe3+/spermidine/putrescine transport system ATPase subunit
MTQRDRLGPSPTALADGPVTTLQGVGLVRRYGAIAAVDDVSLEVGAGRVLAVLGPSGCGKSTLLRLLAGLEPADAGRVEVAGRDVTAWPAHRRDVGMVFQDHALFPHLDVASNVAFGLVEARWARDDAEARTQELLAHFELAPLARRRVDALSGGERQRVAVARALAPRPKVLLLDEPLASLDRGLRERLASELAATLRAPELGSIFVTHDLDEALAVGDEIAVMRRGRFVQIGPAAEVVARPADAWTARFLGHPNVFEGTAARGLPGAERQGAVLLREGLVRVRAADYGGGLEATVVGAGRDRAGVRLALALPSLGRTVAWRGAEREVGALPAVGDAVRLEIPDEAWWPLAPASPAPAAAASGEEEAG